MFDDVGADDVVKDALVGKLEGEVEIALVIIREFFTEPFARSGIDAGHTDVLFEERPSQQSIGAAEVEDRAALRDRGDDLDMRSRTRAFQRVVDVVIDQVATIASQMDLVEAVPDGGGTGAEILRRLGGGHVLVVALRAIAISTTISTTVAATIAIVKRRFVYRMPSARN